MFSAQSPKKNLGDGDTLESADKSVAKSLVIVGVLFAALIVHIVQWNEFSIEILPLKVKEYAGLATKEDLLRTAEICKLRKKGVCVELTYSKILRKDPINQQVLLDLAKLRMERKLYKDVVHLLSQYFHSGGSDGTARFILSQALFHTGDVSNAKKQLNYLVFGDSKDPSPDVARFYVKALMQKKDWGSAQKVILHFRKNRKNASLFLEKEFKEIRKHLRQS